MERKLPSNNQPNKLTSSFEDKSAPADNKINQMHAENDTWLRTLDYFFQENYYLKNRLAQIAKMKIDATWLPHLEAFQNKFIDKDTVLSIIKKEIIQQDNWLKNWENNRIPNDTLMLTQSNLRNDMQKIEHEFNNLKFEFNKYLMNVLQ